MIGSIHPAALSSFLNVVVDYQQTPEQSGPFSIVFNQQQAPGVAGAEMREGGCGISGEYVERSDPKIPQRYEYSVSTIYLLSTCVPLHTPAKPEVVASRKA